MEIGVSTFLTLLSSPESRPDLEELHKLGSGKKLVKIREEVASEWLKLAVQLKFKQGIIKIIQADNQGSEDAFDKLMMRWLDGAGHQPVTWGTLLLALYAAGFTTLASDVEEVLGL